MNKFFSSSPWPSDFRLVPPSWDDETDGQTDVPPINEPMLALISCFAQPKSGNEVQQARLSAVPIRMQKDTAWCINILKDWSTAAEKVPSDIYMLSPQQLQHYLSRFVLEARKKDGTEYRSSRHPLAITLSVTFCDSYAKMASQKSTSLMSAFMQTLDPPLTSRWRDWSKLAWAHVSARQSHWLEKKRNCSGRKAFLGPLLKGTAEQWFLFQWHVLCPPKCVSRIPRFEWWRNRESKPILYTQKIAPRITREDSNAAS